MPTYEYICAACGYEFEQFQSIKADPTRICPNCGADQAQRKISGGAAIIFKGGGFYETDYRSESYNDAKKKDTEAAGGKSDSKSDAKSEPAKAESTKSAEPAKGDAPQPSTAKPEAPKSTPAASNKPAAT